MPYEAEVAHALLTVTRATLLTRRVFTSSTKGTLSKTDTSPVTIGDFGAQALIISSLRHAFPNDAIIAEEESSSLASNPTLTSEIFSLVSSTSLSPEEESQLGGSIKDESQLLSLLDMGKSPGGPSGRVWALDPIDGTKGFLRGGQYAVCLALIEDGDVKVGVLGCPNLPLSDTAPLPTSAPDPDDPSTGVLFSATLGGGATSRPLTQTSSKSQVNGVKTIHMHSLQPDGLPNATFCESVEAAHSSHSHASAIAALLHIPLSHSVRMDSQAKYGSIARGAGDIYLRLPIPGQGYVEKIWDHAAGDLIVREAGGVVTDARGQKLDFGKGRRLEENTGVVAAPQGVHDAVIKAVREVLEGKKDTDR